MKHQLNLIILALVFMTSAVAAQSTDKALARVRYTYIHIQDTTQRDKPYQENMLLVTGKNASVYTSYDKINRNIENKKKVMEQLQNLSGSGNTKIEIKSEMKGPVTATDYFFFLNENKMFIKEKLINHYLIEEPMAKIDWKILKDTMSISGIPCQKATAFFKGRNWMAWFATEIPFQSGPWKLNGLPGLIVQAEDDKKEVKFEFAGLENVSSEVKNAATEDEQKITLLNGTTGIIRTPGMETAADYFGNTIKLPVDAIKTTRKELDKLKEARDKDPQGFLQAQLAANGIQGGFKISNSSRPAAGNAIKKPVINNPIEIQDKR